jgi:hypothetical protein
MFLYIYISDMIIHLIGPDGEDGEDIGKTDF